jgi:uncharacterized membrane protein YqaE (UPF0057 family)
MIVVAVLLPWLALLLRGHILQALLCLVLQLTLLGWIPAAIWAVVVVNNDAQERRHQQLMQALRGR